MTSQLFRVILSLKRVNSLSLSFRKCSSQVILKSDVANSAEGLTKVSTLFVPGRKGGDVYQIVKPVVDVQYLVDNLGPLKLSCDLRGIELDLDKTLNIANQWISLKEAHSILVQTNDGYSEEINRLKSLNSEEGISELTEKQDDVIKKLHAEKSKIYDLEDILMPLLQKIPHFLHSNTPLQFNVMDICKEPINNTEENQSHTKIAESIIFPNNSSLLYFLNGKLAHLEFAIQSYFADKMRSTGFSPLSCVDFCKSFIIEAVGSDPLSPQDSIIIKEKKLSSVGQKLHLVGGASLESLCAYLTNMNIARTNLPLKYFSVGRHYNAMHNISKSLNLFSVVQSTNVHNILLSESSVEKEFDSLVELMLACYSQLNLPFRTIRVAAKNLKVTECRRTELEIWAPSVKDYIPVAYVSQHDDFISKRLHITFGQEYKKEGYCNIVEGAICNTPVIIGCIVENFQTKDNDFTIPDVVQKYMLVQ